MLKLHAWMAEDRKPKKQPNSEDPFSCLATIDMDRGLYGRACARKFRMWGAVVPFLGELDPRLTVWPGPRTTCQVSS